ncbi:MAG TPA: type II secretion system F family protein [Anaeromyxobacter sp.]
MPVDGAALTAAIVLVLALATAAWTVGSARAGRRERMVARLRVDRSGTAAVAAAPAPGLARRLFESLRPIARIATPTREDELSRLRLGLARAGLRSEHALQLFLGAKVVLALASTLGVLTLNASRAEPLQGALALAVLACAAGFYAPNLWLSKRRDARQLAIRRGLPDSLDLLVTCVEAGVALDAGLLRVAGETRVAFPVLADELELTFLEVKAGMNRPEAFRRLADRTGVDDLKQLAATLAQTELFGTSIGAALRVQAEGMRVRRMLRAEERAAMVAVKMTLPLVFCILPSLFAVIMGPAVVNIMETLLPRMGNR